MYINPGWHYLIKESQTGGKFKSKFCNFFSFLPFYDTELSIFSNNILENGKTYCMKHQIQANSPEMLTQFS